MTPGLIVHGLRLRAKAHLTPRSSYEGVAVTSLVEWIWNRPAQPASMANPEAWWAWQQKVRDQLEGTVARAVAGGYGADRPAYAFASGYQEALRALLGPQTMALGLGGDIVALTATEATGNHPRDIRTELSTTPNGLRLSGEKSWAMLGPAANRFLVVATEGLGADGKSQLRALLVPTRRAGVHTPAPDKPSPVVPEIPHTRAIFEEVEVAPEEVLPGDGYAHYLKPFRTLEDLHVHAALLGWLLQVLRRVEAPQDLCERFLSSLLAAVELGSMDARHPATHVALAGFLTQGYGLVEEAGPHFERTDEATQARWTRDRALLHIARRARERRREVAWSQAPSGAFGPKSPN